MRIELKPISVNEAWKGRRFKTDKYDSYERDFNLVVPRAKEMIMGCVEVEYYFYIVNHAKTDYDNLIKCTQDLLVKKGYIKDDRYIYKATIYKIPSEKDFIEFKFKKYDY